MIDRLLLVDLIDFEELAASAWDEELKHLTLSQC